MNINKPAFLFLLSVTLLLPACNAQVKKNFPKGSLYADRAKLIKSQGSANVADNVHCILQDKNGNLWFGTTADGAYRYNGKFFTNFTINDGLTSNGIFSIVEDKDGTIWFGTTSGLSRYDGKSFSDIPLVSANGNNNTSANPFVFCILQDKSGKLWLGTNNGVYWYNGKTFTFFLDNASISNSQGLDLKTVNRMLEDKHGNIWFTSKTEGLSRYDGKSVVSYKPNDEAYFWGLLEDKEGNIWAGGRNKGVWRYDGKTFSKALEKGRFDSYIACSIIQDKKGNIWFGTEAGDPSKRETEGGVWVYDGISFKNFSKKDGLSHNGIWSLLEDKAGNIWVGTRNTGLSRFDGKTFTSFSE